jgi:hypothetical protein
MSDLFEEAETKASYERLIEAGLDQRIAFMTAATDAVVSTATAKRLHTS